VELLYLPHKVSTEFFAFKPTQRKYIVNALGRVKRDLLKCQKRPTSVKRPSYPEKLYSKCSRALTYEHFCPVYMGAPNVEHLLFFFFLCFSFILHCLARPCRALIVPFPPCFSLLPSLHGHAQRRALTFFCSVCVFFILPRLERPCRALTVLFSPLFFPPAQSTWARPTSSASSPPPTPPSASPTSAPRANWLRSALFF